MGDVIMKRVGAERFTPYTLARKLDARVLLESASFHKGRERYSILLIREAFSVFERDRQTYLVKDGQRYSLKSRGRDILDVLSYFAAQHRDVELPFPFPAGGIGYLSYEYSAQFDTIRLDAKPDDLDLPDAYFIFGHLFAIFDHYTDTVTIAGINYREHEIDVEAAIDDAISRINDLDFNFMSQPGGAVAATIASEDDRDWFEGSVETVRDEIIRGNLLQGVLSRRLMIDTELTALDAYRSLRSANPSPYMFYLDFGTFQLFGASPEVHVKSSTEHALLRPIAGTRPRGATEAQDLELERDLLSDRKELAEHLMLIDLARNDLGRVSRPGSVALTERMVIERYSHVMHIVSQVESELEEGRDGTDAIRATFPAGTVSGAPKIKAIETINRIEPVTRGFYAGIVGYVEPDGSVDTCIAIRCAVKRGSRLVLQAGAGIVYDSVPANEFIETQNKLGALAGSVGLEL